MVLQQRSRNFPAGPTKGRACSSSVLPGASPMSRIEAYGSPPVQQRVDDFCEAGTRRTAGYRHEAVPCLLSRYHRTYCQRFGTRVLNSRRQASASASLGARQSLRGERDPSRSHFGGIRQARPFELTRLNEPEQKHLEPLLDRHQVVFPALRSGQRVRPLCPPRRDRFSVRKGMTQVMA